MFNTVLKPNTIVQMGTVIGVIEGEDIYRKGQFNVYCGYNSKRVTCKNEVTNIISEEYVGQPLFAFQVYNKIK